MENPLTLSIAWLLAALTLVRADEFYIAPDGSDANPGTALKPFATLERARDAVRSLKQSGTISKGSVTVWIQPGTYARAQTFELTSADSGSETSPVIYRAAGDGEARLHAAREIPATAFKPLTNPSVAARLDAAARKYLVQLDLAGLGLNHAGPYPTVFNDGGGLFELYVNEQRMPLSRWPNTGFVTMAKVLDRGDWSKTPSRHGGTFVARENRVERWRADTGVWLEGFWRVPWEPFVLQVQSIAAGTREIAFAAPIGGGIGSKYAKPGELGDGKEPWCAINLLEEIDQPGEWCVDFAAKTLYFWPPGDLSSARICLADFDQPLVTLRDVSHLTWRGMVLESSLGNGVEITGGTDNLIAGCTFRNLGGAGVIIQGGNRHGVRSSDFHGLGFGGIYLSGGDRKTLSPAGHFAENNHLHHLGIRKKTYAAAIHVGTLKVGSVHVRAFDNGDAIGCRVTHNLIHDLPHAGVLYGGNDHLFEFNEIARIALHSGDVGAFYTWNDWTSRGNTVRYNFVHDSPHANAFYMDDGDSGDSVFGNVIYRCFYGPFIGGGHDNAVQNNLIIDCERALHFDSRGVARGYAANPKLVARLQSANPQQPPWSTRYPALARLVDGRRDVPTGNVIEKNVAVSCKLLFHSSGKPDEFDWSTVRSNLELPEAAAAFEDAARLNFRLRPNSAVFQKLPDFKPIPFEQIGLVRDEFRTELPAFARSRAPSDRDGRAFDSNTDVQHAP